MWCDVHSCTDSQCGCQILTVNVDAVKGKAKALRKDLYLPTYTGAKFNFLDPLPGHIHIQDMAHALSGMPRYFNHTVWPVTVAFHCCCMHDYLNLMWWDGQNDGGYLLAEHGLDLRETDYRNLMKYTLFHDGPEAYLGEWPKPIKAVFGDVMKRYEEKIQEMIWAKINCIPSPAIKAVVDAVDVGIVYAETELSGNMRYDLLPMKMSDSEIKLGRHIYKTLDKYWVHQDHEATEQYFIQCARRLGVRL